MAGCSAFGCDGDDGFAFECNECGQRFCAAHRLPENHRCPALLNRTDDDRKHFETGLADKDPKSSTTSESALTLVEKQRRSVRQWWEKDESPEDATLRAGDSLFSGESPHRPWHRNRSGDEDLTPREKQLRAQERMKQQETEDSSTNTRKWPVVLFIVLGLVGVVIASYLLLVLLPI